MARTRTAQLPTTADVSVSGAPLPAYIASHFALITTRGLPDDKEHGEGIEPSCVGQISECFSEILITGTPLPEYHAAVSCLLIVRCLANERRSGVEPDCVSQSSERDHPCGWLFRLLTGTPLPEYTAATAGFLFERDGVKNKL